MTSEDFFDRIPKTPSKLRAPSKLKARIYTSLVRAQQQDAPLEPLTETKRSGHGLCVFERLVEIAPVGTPAKSMFQCTACHARVLAENMENPPIWWPHCPYAEFKKP
jgi:hypothetical protein